MLTVMGLVVPVLYFGAMSDAAAYCIHNSTDTHISVEQMHGGTATPFKKFKKDIKPGAKSCCNWGTHDCNTKGGKSASATWSKN